MLEEVLRILGKDPTTSKKWVELVLEYAAALGFGCVAGILSTSSWSNVPRDRQILTCLIRIT